MDDDDFKKAVKTMVELWPKRAGALTSEQTMVWRCLVDRYPWQWCQKALRRHAEESKFFPHPCEIKSYLQEQRRQQDGNEVPKQEQPSWLDTVRGDLARIWPARAGEFRQMSDDEIQCACARSEYENAAKTYGHVSRTTVARWQAWQWWRWKCGHRPDEPVNGGHWSEAAREQYCSETCDAS